MHIVPHIRFNERWIKMSIKTPEIVFYATGHTIFVKERLSG